MKTLSYAQLNNMPQRGCSVAVACLGLVLPLFAHSVWAGPLKEVSDIDWSRIEEPAYVQGIKTRALDFFHEYRVQASVQMVVSTVDKSDLPWKAGEAVSHYMVLAGSQGNDEVLRIERRFLGQASTEECKAWVQDFYFTSHEKYTAPYLVNCDQIDLPFSLNPIDVARYSKQGKMIYQPEFEAHSENENRFNYLLAWQRYSTGEPQMLIVKGTHYYFSREGQLVGLDQSGLPRDSSTDKPVAAGWYSNGQLKFTGGCWAYPCSSEYDRSGIWQEWYADGKKRLKIEYGQPGEYGVPRHTGEYLAWYENGQLKERVRYHENRYPDYREVQSWYANGQLVQDCDKLTGLCTSWYENGQIMMQGTVSRPDATAAFARIGEWKGFYENGKPLMHAHYEDGVQVGVWQFWYPNGQLRYEIEFAQNHRELQDGPKSVKHWDEKGNIARLPGVPELVDIGVTQKYMKKNEAFRNALKNSGGVIDFKSGGGLASREILGLTAEGHYVVQDFHTDDLGFWGYSYYQEGLSLDIEKEIQFWEHYNPFISIYGQIFEPPLSDPYVMVGPPETVRNQWGEVWAMPERVKGALTLWYAPDFESARPWESAMEESNYDVRSESWYSPFSSSWWGPSRYKIFGPQKWIEVQYKNGKLDGSWKVWYVNGGLAQQGQYVQGRRDGLWTQWDEMGAKECQVTFTKGVAVEKSWQFWNVLGERVPFVSEGKTKQINDRFRFGTLYDWRYSENNDPVVLMKGCLL